MALSPCTFIGHEPESVLKSGKWGDFCDRCIKYNIGFSRRYKPFKDEKRFLPSLYVNGKYVFVHWNPLHHFKYGWQADAAHEAGSWVLGYMADWRERCYWSGARWHGRFVRIVRRMLFAYFDWQVNSLIIREAKNPTVAVVNLQLARGLNAAMADRNRLVVENGRIVPLRPINTDPLKYLSDSQAYGYALMEVERECQDCADKSKSF